jgi:hypothetical protein
MGRLVSIPCVNYILYRFSSVLALLANYVFPCPRQNSS